MDFQLSDEDRLLQQTARDLAVREFARDAYSYARTGEYPRRSMKVLAEHGMMGMTVREPHGGGRSIFEACVVMEAVAQVCPHSGDVVQMGNMGPIRIIDELGTEEQRARFLPCLCGGAKIISIAMSEPDAGSAATDLKTSAKYDGGSVVLNGQKCFSSNAPHADLFVVFVRFGPRTRDCGALVVETGAPGFAKGKTEHFMSGEAHCALHFEGARVPRENVLIDSDGFRVLMPIFNVERLGNATRCLALAQAAYGMTVEHTKTRRQFGRPLCEFQGVQWMVADMRVKLEAARLLLYRALSNARAGLPTAIETTAAKIYCNEMARQVADDAIQLHGAYGYSTELPLEFLYRKIRGWSIAGGTVQVLRNRLADLIYERSFSQRPPRPE
ncbi:MAG: acyl-CoA dehydrogenase family protein [Candidatus Tectomicrobia bacterium]|nr:acyl-CoA dehydrogenase family protein [Candidatus Tectomicrobia bacterium]